ncbi:MAG: ornithine cyclodeaminase family protein [Burkholderiales bacterium]|nr:MAG: ornithine cyclodeaminase family protein [Burkholderiales bacterium]
MMHISDQQVKQALSYSTCVELLRSAFLQHASNQAVILPRLRASLSPVSLSVMGAILPAVGVMGVKSYPTIAGKFNFLVNLFDSTTGEHLCAVDANEVTAFRTAALTQLAFEVAGVKSMESLAIFGTGIQAWSHLQCLSQRWQIGELHVVGVSDEESLTFAQKARATLGINAVASGTARALSECSNFVTATRSSEPLFDGASLPANAFVAAIGSSKPQSREIDEAAMRRASEIIVEWRPQSCAEAGEFAQLPQGVTEMLPIVEIGDMIVNANGAKKASDGIRIFKSVGVGLSDVAICAYLYRYYR